MRIEPYTVGIKQGKYVGDPSWPSNFAGRGFAVVESGGRVLARLAFRIEAEDWIKENSAPHTD